jgi:hypothetical protein
LTARQPVLMLFEDAHWIDPTSHRGELTKTIIESGLLREEDGNYALDGALRPRAIPTTYTTR